MGTGRSAETGSDANRLQAMMFRKLVTANTVKALTLSVTGIIDTIIVGQFMGPEGLPAMMLAMPVFALFSIFSIVLGSGLTVVISRKLATGNPAGAGMSFRSVLTAAVIISLVFMIIGAAGTDTATGILLGSVADEKLISATADYLMPVMIGALPIILYDILGDIALLEGADRNLMYASAAILITDIAGDIIAVLTNGGIRGIAAASAAAYLCACVIVALHFTGPGSMFSLRLRVPDISDLAGAVSFGIPMGIGSLCNLIWPAAFNYLILIYGTVNGLAALSVQDAVRYIPGALATGIGSTVLLLTGIFFSERDEDALREERKEVLRYSIAGGIAAAVIMTAAASALAQLFTDDADIIMLSTRAIRLYMPGIPFLIINTAAVSYLQGMGRRTAAGIYMLLNHLLIPVVLGLILGSAYGNTGIYAAFPACEIVMACVLAGVLHMIRRRGDTPAAYGGRDDPSAELRRDIHTVQEAAAVSEELAELCRAGGIDEIRAQNLALCAEELAVNSIEHGFNDGRDHHLSVRAVIRPEEIILRLRDDCRKFDLTERYRMVDPEDPAENIGLRLIFAAADDVSYSSALDLNNVCIRISR